MERVRHFLKNSRWCVLTSETFYTFKEEKVYKSPTEELTIKKIKTIKSDEGDKISFVRIILNRK